MLPSSRFEMEEIHEDRGNSNIKEHITHSNGEHINSNVSQGMITSHSTDGGREARISLRKNRIEQNRLARAKPTGQQDGKLIFIQN